MDAHVERADPALVGSGTGYVVLEAGREPRALVVEETVVVTASRKLRVGADEDVAVSVGSPRDDVAANLRPRCQLSTATLRSHDGDDSERTI